MCRKYLDTLIEIILNTLINKSNYMCELEPFSKIQPYNFDYEHYI